LFALLLFAEDGVEAGLDASYGLGEEGAPSGGFPRRRHGSLRIRVKERHGHPIMTVAGELSLAAGFGRRSHNAGRELQVARCVASQLKLLLLVQERNCASNYAGVTP
jgi:hypothetical protein